MRENRPLVQMREMEFDFGNLETENGSKKGEAHLR